MDSGKAYRPISRVTGERAVFFGKRLSRQGAPAQNKLTKGSDPFVNLMALHPAGLPV